MSGRFGNKRKDLTFYAHTVTVAPAALKRIASNPGWIDQETVRFREMWNADVSSNEIAEAFGIHVSTVRYRAIKMGLPKRSLGGGASGKDWLKANGHRFNILWHEHAIKLAKRGLPLKTIAHECQRSVGVVSALFRRKGIRLNDIRASFSKSPQTSPDQRR